ncbi:MAG TPA: mercuric reductase [Acetobacteraceae bacterium]|nr:mercuric reductase [Acetobacteraceae bacterium]
MDRQEYDVVIIGAGQAGIPLAWGVARTGRTVALVERARPGGSCINFGCTPTKAVLASARLLHQVRRSAAFGIRVGEVEVDFPAVLARARAIAEASRRGIEDGFRGSENPRLLMGHARLEGRDGAHFRVRIGATTLAAREVVLNTGTRTAVPPIPGLADIAFIHAGNWLQHSDLPAQLAIIGSGAVGLEMAQFYRRMGSDVTVIDIAPQIAGKEDAEVAGALQRQLEAEGIAFRLGAQIREVAQDGRGIIVRLGEGEVAAGQVFIATGRRPNTDDLGLDTVGVAVSDRGIVQADARLATTVEGIWVAGDIRGGPMFTHTAWDDYRILLSQMTGDGTRTTDRIVPWVIFTDPELGRVGMTEAEARATGRAVKVARFDMRRSGKAAEIGEDEGFIKVIADAATGELLGAAVLAVDGGELVHAYVDLMNAGAPYTALRDSIQAHPTLSEAVQSAVAALDDVP